jgi:hypothetical protein
VRSPWKYGNVKGKPTNVLIVGISTNHRIPLREQKRPKLRSDKSLLLRRNREITIEIKPTNERRSPAAIPPKSVSSVAIVASDDYELTNEALDYR